MNTKARNFMDELNEWERCKVTSKYTALNREEVERCGIVVYGGAVTGQSLVAQLIACGITPAWIIDKNAELCGSRYMGVEILPTESLGNVGERYVLIASTHINEMRRECEKYGVEKWILTWQLYEFCPMIGHWGIGMTEELRTEGLIKGIELLADEKSREIYKAFVRWHYVYDNDFSKLRDPIGYFPNDLRDRIDYSRFVDCGVFTGDTLKIWIEQYLLRKPTGETYEYWAFEPNEHSFGELSDYVRILDSGIRNKIQLLNAGVGRQDAKVTMVGSEGGGGCVAETNDGLQ